MKVANHDSSKRPLERALFHFVFELRPSLVVSRDSYFLSKIALTKSDDFELVGVIPIEIVNPLC